MGVRSQAARGGTPVVLLPWIITVDLLHYDKLLTVFLFLFLLGIFVAVGHQEEGGSSQERYASTCIGLSAIIIFLDALMEL